MRCASLAVCLLLFTACDEPPERATPSPEPATDPTDDIELAEHTGRAEALPGEDVVGGDVTPASVRPERPTTAAERRAQVAALPAAERARLRGRSEHLARGRRLGREGDHEGALSEFEAALEVAPHDATVLCEAGYQALRLGRYGASQAHLMAAISHSAPPRTRAMCLYNLGRVQEVQDELFHAVRAYRESLQLRPNRIVQARMDALVERIGELGRIEDSEAWDEPGEVDEDALEGRHFSTLRALADAAHCGHTGWGAGAATNAPAVPSGVSGLLEVNTYECESDETREILTVLVARGEAGWYFVQSVARTDMGDSYGVLEAAETVNTFRFEGMRLIVLVTGGYDEVEGEAAIYFACEREHPDDDDAIAGCFDDEFEPAAPETWREGFSFTVQDGRLASDLDPPEFTDADFGE